VVDVTISEHRQHLHLATQFPHQRFQKRGSRQSHAHSINMQVRHLTAMAARWAAPRSLAAAAGPAIVRRSVAAQFSARSAAFPAALAAFPLDRRQFSTSDAAPAVPVELSDGVGQLTGVVQTGAGGRILCFEVLTGTWRVVVLLDRRGGGGGWDGVECRLVGSGAGRAGGAGGGAHDHGAAVVGDADGALVEKRCDRFISLTRVFFRRAQLSGVGLRATLFPFYVYQIRATQRCVVPCWALTLMYSCH
jgi:hypothetical protein